MIRLKNHCAEGITNMNKYVLFTDSACDLKPEILNEWGVGHDELTFRFDTEDKSYLNFEMPTGEFYEKMKGGAVAKTAAINPDTFIASFEKILKEGKDILHLAFSSGLSTTYNSARIAAESLKESYPERKIIVIDTLAASAGQGLLVYLAKKKKDEGATLEENAEYVKSLIFKLCHWFTVDDLVYLKRGGRISALSYIVGNAIGIKPVLHVDNEGHLVSVQKVRGRRTAIDTIVKKYEELADDKEGATLYISHADCERDVKIFADAIKAKFGNDVDLVTDVGPVIGAHAGPGTLAVFFIGKER